MISTAFTCIISTIPIKMATSETEDIKPAECITLKLNKGAKVNIEKRVQSESSEISGAEKNEL